MSSAADVPTPDADSSFAERIKWLIRHVGSATEIARKCGFSEGVVRSWRDGHTDPSRARCVTLARTLGISLLWLVAGEGAVAPDADEGISRGALPVGAIGARMRTRASDPGLRREGEAGMDSQRLRGAMRILQSELGLAGDPLPLADTTDLLAQLYEVIGPGGTQVDIDAMLAFNQRLAERIGRVQRDRKAPA